MSMSVMKARFNSKETMSVPFECHDGIEYRIVKVKGKAECSFDNSVAQFNTSDCELDVYFSLLLFSNSFFFVLIFVNA